MSGHSKWSTIKHKKGRTDAKRGKIFSRLAKELIQATRDGGKDPLSNARLRTAIASAKAVNKPNDYIDRAIKKGAGELDGAVLEALSYEAYASGGVAIMVDCLSDNRNRTAAEVRHMITKANGNLASNGAVAWMFHRKARFVIEGEKADEETLMELCFGAEVEVDDASVAKQGVRLLDELEDFDDVQGVVSNADFDDAVLEELAADE